MLIIVPLIVLNWFYTMRASTGHVISSPGHHSFRGNDRTTRTWQTWPPTSEPIQFYFFDNHKSSTTNVMATVLPAVATLRTLIFKHTYSLHPPEQLTHSCNTSDSSQALRQRQTLTWKRDKWGKVWSTATEIFSKVWFHSTHWSQASTAFNNKPKSNKVKEDTNGCCASLYFSYTATFWTLLGKPTCLLGDLGIKHLQAFSVPYVPVKLAQKRCNTSH